MENVEFTQDDLRDLAAFVKDLDDKAVDAPEIKLDQAEIRFGLLTGRVRYDEGEQQHYISF